MWRRTSFPLALALMALAGCGGEEGGREALRLGAPQSFDRSGWQTDFSRHAVALEEIRTGGPPRDGVPPIDRPKPVSQARAERFVTEQEPVIAVEAGREARAYPMRTLVWHEIVNDRLGGRPIAVTYSPLTNSTLVFDRRVGGRELSFGTTGNLRRSNAVMWDRQTQSWWQQLTAEAIVGALTGKRPRPLPAQVLSFETFRDRYRRGDVLSRDTGAEREYELNPYLGYDEPRKPPHLFRGRVDDRLPPKQRVVAMAQARPALAVPYARLERNPVAQLDVGGVPAVVLYDRRVVSPIDADAIERSKAVGAAGVFDRRLGERTLSFEPDGVLFTDRQTRSSWDVTGRAVAGRLRGHRLRPLSHDEPFWFALAAFRPDARVGAGD